MHKCRSFLLSQDLQSLMDPSRNMSKYRNLLNGEHGEPPLVRFSLVVTNFATSVFLDVHLPLVGREEWKGAPGNESSCSCTCGGIASSESKGFKLPGSLSRQLHEGGIIVRTSEVPPSPPPPKRSVCFAKFLSFDRKPQHYGTHVIVICNN